MFTQKISHALLHAVNASRDLAAKHKVAGTRSELHWLQGIYPSTPPCQKLKHFVESLRYSVGYHHPDYRTVARYADNPDQPQPLPTVTKLDMVEFMTNDQVRRMPCPESHDRHEWGQMTVASRRDYLRSQAK